jgi:myo-inositol-1(or 4)-monophosphatase
MTDLTALLSVAGDAVDQGARLMRTSSPGERTAKGERDYATGVDFAIERALRDFLHDATPDIAFVGEEEGRTGGTPALWWTLDPVDGTVNFAHHLPLCAVSLALMRDDHPVLGVIDLPFLEARYTAVQGNGAFRDGRRLRVSRADTLAGAIVSIGDFAVGQDSERKNRTRFALAEQLASRVLRVRMFGSAAIDLVWLAEGKTDASVTLSNKPWDVAAGVIIAREAGADILDSDGTQHRAQSSATIAAGPTLTSELQTLVRDVINGKGPGPR